MERKRNPLLFTVSLTMKFTYEIKRKRWGGKKRLGGEEKPVNKPITILNKIIIKKNNITMKYNRNKQTELHKQTG